MPSQAVHVNVLEDISYMPNQYYKKRSKWESETTQAEIFTACCSAMVLDGMNAVQKIVLFLEPNL